MSLAAVKQEIRTVLEQAQSDWTEYDLLIEIDNRKAVDQANAPVAYLQAQVVPLVGDQFDLGTKPLTKQWGQILLCGVQRENSGTADADRLVEFVGRYFHAQDLATVRCETMEYTKGKVVKGWWYQPVIINFWFIWE